MCDFLQHFYSFLKSNFLIFFSFFYTSKQNKIAIAKFLFRVFQFLFLQLLIVFSIEAFHSLARAFYVRKFGCSSAAMAWTIFNQGHRMSRVLNTLRLILGFWRGVNGFFFYFQQFRELLKLFLQEVFLKNLRKNVASDLSE